MRRVRIVALAVTAVMTLSACTGSATPAPTGAPTAGSTAAPTEAPNPANPAPNTAFSGSLDTVPGVSGTISFVISETGQIAEMKLDGGLANFDCGGGKTVIDSGTTTYFFPDPIAIEGGRFSLSRSGTGALDWDGVFDSATTVRGNIRLSGGPDCQNRPPSVPWSATSERPLEPSAAATTVAQATPTSTATSSPTPTATNAPVQSSAPPPKDFTDAFDGAVDAGWTWVNEDPTRWSIDDEPGWLHIVAQASPPISNLLIRKAPTGSYTVTTRLRFEPTSNFQFAGLVITGPTPDGDRLQFGRAYCDGVRCVGDGLYFDRVKAGALVGTNDSTPLKGRSEVYLALDVTDNLVTALYSYDGDTWSIIGTEPLDPGYTNVGLIAHQADPEIIAAFDFVSIGRSPTPKPTPVPTPSPTPVPTPSPVPTVTTQELRFACSKGTPIPATAKYAGTVHPLVVVYHDDKAWILDNDVYDINAKWYGDDWPGPIQLVVCDSLQKAVRVGSCGSYKRKSDGVVGQIVRYRYTEVVRVVIARTGKTLQSKTYYGSTPACKSTLSIPASGPPPWKIFGDDVDAVAAINKYATAVSKQKVQ